MMAVKRGAETTGDRSGILCTLVTDSVCGRYGNRHSARLI